MASSRTPRDSVRSTSPPSSPTGRPALVASEKRYRSRLRAAKATSLGHVLLRCARLLDEQAVAQIRSEQGAPTLRPAHTKLLPHLDLEGTRLTELARRLQVSKQAAGQLVEEMTQMGVLERFEDPSDGRARLVRFTRLGRRGLLHGLQVLEGIEAELSKTVGTRNLRTLRTLLLLLLDALEARAVGAG